MLCKYADILGKPNEGFHKPRLLGMARNDLIGYFIIVIVIVIVCKTSLVKTAVIVFIVAQLMHAMFCVETAFIKFLKNE